MKNDTTDTENKILIIGINIRPDQSEINDILQKIPSKTEYVGFDSLDELPSYLNGQNDIGTIFLSEKINQELLQYIKRLRSNGNKKCIVVAGKLTSPKVYSMIKDLDKCALYEISDFTEPQIVYLVNQLTESSQNEYRQQKLFENFTHLINENPSAIVSVEESGRILSINNNFREQFNYEESELIGFPLSAILPEYGFIAKSGFPDDQIPLKGNAAQTSIVSKDGKLNNCSVQILRQEYSGKTNIHFFISDLSEMHLKDQKLEKRNTSFAKLAEILDTLSSASNNLLQDSVLMNDIRLLLKCDYLYLNPVFINPENEYEIQYQDLTADDPRYDKQHESIILDLLDREEITVTQIKNSPADNMIRSLLFIPLQSGRKINGFISAFYANNYKPDNFILDMAEIIGKVIAVDLARSRYLKELAISEQHFKALVENAQDGIYQSEPDGQIIYANEALVKLLGFNTFNEINELNAQSDIYLDPEHREKFKADIENEKNVKNYIVKLRTKDGRPLTVIENAHLVERADGSFFYEGVIRDITEYNALSEQLKMSHNFSDELIEKANVMIIAFDKDDNIEIWNKKAEQVTGYSSEEATKDSSFLRKLYPNPDYYKYVMQAVRNELFSPKNKRLEFELVTRAGEKKRISWSGFRIAATQHGVLRVAVGMDQTETHEVEKLITENREAQLHRKIATEVNSRLKSVLSHLQENAGFADSKEYPDSGEIAVLLKNAEHLNMQLELFSEEPERETEEINLNYLVDDVSSLIGRSCPPSITIHKELRAIHNIEGDSAQLSRAISGLILNAIEAMPNGGAVNIRLAPVDGHESKRLTKPGNKKQGFVSVSISDSGNGIPEDQKTKIFDPFFSTKKETGHLGTGLTYTQKIIKEYGGHLFVDSFPSRGTMVSVYLPNASEIAPQAGVTVPETKIQTGKKEILVVDDESIIRDLIEDVLEEQGYNVYTAENGLEGLSIFKEKYKTIDLVVLDIIMPQLDGKELYHKIKKINPSIKVLVTSGYSKPHVREELIAFGVDGFLPKPFPINNLIEQVKNILPS